MERVPRTPSPSRPAKSMTSANGAYAGLAVRTVPVAPAQATPLPSAKPNGRAKSSPKPNGTAAMTPTKASATDRYRMISTAAYFLAEQRKFEAGHELEDWCTAECQVDKVLGIRPPEGLRHDAS